MLICAKCGGNAHVGNAWYCGMDDVLTCGDCGLICHNKGGDHNFHNCDGASCFMKYHDESKEESGGHCWCMACLHSDCADPAACRAETCGSDGGNACPQYRETGVECDDCIRLDAEVAAELVAWEIAGKPDFWRLTDGPCPN